MTAEYKMQYLMIKRKEQFFMSFPLWVSIDALKTSYFKFKQTLRKNDK
jgi:hypothetical protein